MISRSFRVFGTKKDLENIFNEFQKNNIVNYYRCGKSDSNKITDITKTNNFGFSLSGSHIGNQYLVIKDDKIVRFDNYKHINQKLNETSIVIDLVGYILKILFCLQRYLQSGMIMKVAKKYTTI